MLAISDKCYKARSFDGTEALIPKSQVYAPDFSYGKADAFWVSAWILEQKSMQFSRKKKAYFDSETRKRIFNKKQETDPELIHKEQ
ncbi:MAG: hypothetical protein ACOCXH_04440 [Cyclobacteriaceae bacterium]